MKKVLCSFLIIILSFMLCCCQTENLRKEKETAPPLSDGTKTYYINYYDNKDKLVHSIRYNDTDDIIEESEFSYSYDINGRITKITETDTDTQKYTETEFDKFKIKTSETSYDENDIIINRKDFFKNGEVKKKYNYKSGSETGYILYDYYSDGQLRNETVYSLNGKTVKMTTYYKNLLVYQIKDFSDDGMLRRITKYSYKDDKLNKKSVYDSEFNLIEVTDYTENPPEVTEYKDGEPAKKITAENT